MIRDLAVKKNKNGFYDIYFENGDYGLTSGIETAIWISLFCNKKDPENENWESNNGWVGDQLNDDGFEIGSLLWKLKQANLDDDAIIEAQDEAEDCLIWLKDGGYASNISVSIIKNLDNGIKIDIILTRNNDIEENISFNLWSNTVNIKNEL
jgi:phage gp46-like protein